MIATSTRPRYLAGMSSSIAELIAAYSPQMPAPVRNRAMKYQVGFGEKAVWTVATVYTPRVSMKSFLRPKRPVSCPKNKAPRQAPAT